MRLDKWQSRFLELAEVIRGWSKDPSKQVGAIIVKDRKILSTGYNGFPALIKDDFSNIDQKNQYMVHAEANAILNAAKNGVSVSGASMYVSGLCPCVECAKLIIQSGITEVIYDYNPHHMSSWYKSCKLALKLFDTAGVTHANTMPCVIMLTGKKGSGKSTIARMVSDQLSESGIKSEVISFATPVKQILATALGIDLETLDVLKNTTNTKVTEYRTMRELLQSFGTDAMQHVFGKEVWKNIALEYIKSSHSNVVIIDDWRFPHETISGALKVRVKGGDHSDPHISENALDGQRVHIEIDNTARSLTSTDVNVLLDVNDFVKTIKHLVF